LAPTPSEPSGEGRAKHPRRVSELGEFGLIDRFVSAFRGAPDSEIWSGDDAAVIQVNDRPVVFTTDSLVEDVDFELRWASGVDIGWKVVAINASDVAAMGARPTHAVVSLGLPPSTPISVTDALGEGLREAAERWGISLVGGDVSRASEITVSVAMLGELYAEPITRRGAVIGDAVCITGELGGASVGLKALQAGLVGPGPFEGHSLSPEATEAVIAVAERQLRPLARVEASRALTGSVHCMIDVTDGVLADAEHLAEAAEQRCALDIDLDALPRHPAIPAVLALLPGSSDEQAGEQTRADGSILWGAEDLELLFTCAEDDVSGVARRLQPLPVTRIGTVVARPSATDDEQQDGGAGDARSSGWDHLREG
jgi:thiamine-monophosphate kinase